jgi:hypothetical protein
MGAFGTEAFGASGRFGSFGAFGAGAFGANQITPLDAFRQGAQGVWYDPSDMSTMYQDAAGTIPVTAVEQPVGLILDKRSAYCSKYFDAGLTSTQIAVSDGSAPLLGTSDFTIEGWIYYISGAPAIIAKRPAGSAEGWCFLATEFSGSIGGYWHQSAITAPALTPNTWYHVALERVGSVFTMYRNGVSVGTYSNSGAFQVTGDGCRIGVSGGNSEGRLTGYISDLRVVLGSYVYGGNFTPKTSPLTVVPNTVLLTCNSSHYSIYSVNHGTEVRGLNPFSSKVGNHAYQSTSTNRPIVSARYNLLSATEDFSNAAWAKSSIGVSTENYMAPDGSYTAKKIYDADNTYSVHRIFQSVGTVGIKHTLSIYAKAAEYSNLILFPYSFELSSFNLQNGTFTQAPGTIGSMISVGNGWYLCTLTYTTTSTSGEYITGSPIPSYMYVGTTGRGVYMWHPDLRVSNDGVGLPPYQAVYADGTYDTVGFPAYLKFNGANQCLQTNSIDFTNTDKMTVWAGVRKLSDAALGVLVEMSANSNANTGTFNVQAPGVSLNSYFARSRGTSTADLETTTTYPSPRTNTLTGIGDISGDIARLRVNGVQVAQSTTDQGTGNYGNYPLYIGSRAGASLFFNGNLYSLVIVGKQCSNQELSNMEYFTRLKSKAY